MRKTFKFICAAVVAAFAVSSCYDDTLLRTDLEAIDKEVSDLAARVDALENSLNENIKAVNTLQASMTTLEKSLKSAIEEHGAEVQVALEDELSALEKKLNDAIAKGDQALADAIAAEKKAVETAIQTLQTTLTSEMTKSAESLKAAIAALEKAMGTKLSDLTAKMDAADGKVDGKIADLNAAIEAVKKAYADADTKLSAELVAKIAEAVAKITVTDVKTDGDKVILTLADGSKIEVAKPSEPLTNVDNNGLVTIIEVDGARYWAVVKDGKPESLNILVGADVALEFKVEEGQLYYTTNGKDWAPTGAYVHAEDFEFNFFQGETDEIEWSDDYMDYVPVLEDFYTVVFGGEKYYLPIYKVDNSVVTLKAGKTYFEYGETLTVDIALSDVANMYVMTKPDGWRASLADNKLTVTAPVEAAVTAGYAESDGEVLLHCTTVEGACKVARLAVATTPGFSLTLTKDGKLTIVNPELVTTQEYDPMDGMIDVFNFNDAYVGIAEIADFEADPFAYVATIEDNDDAIYYRISNWKSNTTEWVDGEPIYKIGGAYAPGVYEVDVITTTVAEMYTDFTYDEIPSQSYVIWACPQGESGYPRVEDLVFAYYIPPVEATITEVKVSPTDVEVKVEVSGAASYYVGFATEEMTYGMDIHDYMTMDGLGAMGPFTQFQMAAGDPDPSYMEWVLSQMGMQFGGEYGKEMPETLKLSDIMGGSLTPNTKVYMWVFPIVDGLKYTDYTYEDNLKPYIYDFTTSGLTSGGSATVEFGDATSDFSGVTVPVTATDGSIMVYYKFYAPDVYGAFENDAAVQADLLERGNIFPGNEDKVRGNGDPGDEFVLVAMAVDADGKYGAIKDFECNVKTLEYSETFTASFGTEVYNPFSSGYKYDFPITVQGGEAAKYYYYFGTSEMTDDKLNQLPLQHLASSQFKNTTTSVAENMLKGQYANPSSTYYLAVVVESTDGEFSPVIKKTIEVPAVAEE